MLQPGDTVDLLDGLFGWRGQYIIVKNYDDGKVQIRNVRTNSKQIVSTKKLRRGRLPPFFIAGLNR